MPIERRGGPQVSATADAATCLATARGPCSADLSWRCCARTGGCRAAQEEPSGTSYITPFPEATSTSCRSMAMPSPRAAHGLVEAFAGDTRLQISRKHRPLAGLIRPSSTTR